MKTSGATHLILDCYLDELGAASSVTPFLSDRELVIERPPHGRTPTCAEDFASLWITGSAASVLDDEAWIAELVALLRDALDKQVPVFGICFGHQALAIAHAGREAVRRSPSPEIGWAEIELSAPNPILDGLAPRFPCFVSHFDEVVPDVPGLDLFARSERCAVHGFQIRDKRAFGLQFHPEMPPRECERLVHKNLERHAYLGSDPAPVIAEAVDGRPLGHKLAANFLRDLE